MDDLAPAVGPDTIILPVLNGMRHVQVLKDRFDEAAVVGCVCRCATTLDDNGRIVQLTKLHDLTYGEMDGRSTALQREALHREQRCVKRRTHSVARCIHDRCRFRRSALLGH
jgi:ketopantoate reductase